MGLVGLPRTVRVVFFLIAVCLVVFPAQAQYRGGNDTAEDPCQIAAAEDPLLWGGTPDDRDKHFTSTLGEVKYRL